jgi:hypothetical protein
MSSSFHITGFLRSQLCLELFILLDYYVHSYVLNYSYYHITGLLRSQLCLELFTLLDYYVHSYVLNFSYCWIITFTVMSWIIHITGLLRSQLRLELFVLLDYYVHSYVLNYSYYWIITLTCEIMTVPWYIVSEERRFLVGGFITESTNSFGYSLSIRSCLMFLTANHTQIWHIYLCLLPLFRTIKYFYKFNNVRFSLLIKKELYWTGLL